MSLSFGQSDSLTSIGKSNKECTGVSIVKALDQFMGAMSAMQEVVMIPSRLKDVEAPLPRGPVRSTPPSRASSSIALSLDSSKTAPVTPPQHTEERGAMSAMQEVVMIPSRLKDVEAPLPRGPVRSTPPSRASSSIALSLDSSKTAPVTPPQHPEERGTMSAMQEVVMIPSRLKDVEALLPRGPVRSTPPSRASSSIALSLDSSKTAPVTPPQHPEERGAMSAMLEVVMIPSRLKDVEAPLPRGPVRSTPPSRASSFIALSLDSCKTAPVTPPQHPEERGAISAMQEVVMIPLRLMDVEAPLPRCPVRSTPPSRASSSIALSLDSSKTAPVTPPQHPEERGAMSAMQEVVMIPSRLMDVEAPLPRGPVRSTPPSRASSSIALSLDSSKTAPVTPPQHPEERGAMSAMQEVVMIPSRLMDVEAPLPRGPVRSMPSSRASSSITLSPNSSKTAPVRASSLDEGVVGVGTADLWTYYRMLDSVRQELVSGEAAAAEDSGVGSLGEGTDDDLSSLDSVELRESESQRLAATFRAHLNGLYNVMSQLTQTANLVSEKYQDEVLRAPTS